MGGLVALVSVIDAQAALNVRFAAGDPIKVMIALQKEFQVFSTQHDLRSSAALLGIAPDTEPQRTQWLGYLDHLKTLPSNGEQQNGHDRIRSELKANLEGKGRPVFFQYHDGKKEPRVMVTTGRPLIFLEAPHVVVSVPTQSGGQAMRAAVKSAPTWTERKGQQAPGAAAAGAPSTAAKAVKAAGKKAPAKKATSAKAKK